VGPVLVPAGAVSWRAVRSSGPGGQNVNKVSSRVEVRVDLDSIRGLSAAAWARLMTLVANRRDREGRLLVTSQRTRDQARNLEDAREKVRLLIERALAVPRKRRPTRPSKTASERRIRQKKRRGALKRDRRAGGDEG